jgi:hypothetical protein
MAHDENDVPFIDPTLVDLIGSPADIDDDRKKANFPFYNKAMQLGNNTRRRTKDILDDLELVYLDNHTNKRRYEYRGNPSINRSEFLRNRTYLEAVLGLSEGGFAVQQLTSVQKTIEYKDTAGRSGGMLGFLSPRKGPE